MKRAELWEYAQIHPSDPFYEEFTARYLQRLVAVFGTDHLYGGAPYGETSPEKNPEENYALKKAAALGYMDLLRRVDPKAVWVTDSWDFFWSRDTWTQDRVREYLDAMPADGFFIYDCNPDNLGIPVHRVHANFHGKTLGLRRHALGGRP